MKETAAVALSGATETAVLVLVPAAQPAVREHRAHLDVAASWGVPAHVSVVYPFVPPEDVDDDVLLRLTAGVRTVAAFECVFARTAWFDGDVRWLAPEPDGPFRHLTRAVVAAFPAHQPYGGATRSRRPTSRLANAASAAPPNSGRQRPRYSSTSRSEPESATRSC